MNYFRGRIARQRAVAITFIDDYAWWFLSLLFHNFFVKVLNAYLTLGITVLVLFFFIFKHIIPEYKTLHKTHLATNIHVFELLF